MTMINQFIFVSYTNDSFSVHGSAEFKIEVK